MFENAVDGMLKQLDRVADQLEKIGKGSDGSQPGRSGRSHGQMPVPDIHVEVAAGNGSGVKAVVCPQCGANVSNSVGQGTNFCGHCGAQLLVDDGSPTVTYRTVDETRIRELETEQLLELKRMEIEEKRRPGRIRLTAILAVVGVVFVAIGFFAGDASGDSDSPWYVFAMLGLFSLSAVGFVWIDNSRGGRSS